MLSEAYSPLLVLPFVWRDIYRGITPGPSLSLYPFNCPSPGVEVSLLVGLEEDLGMRGSAASSFPVGARYHRKDASYSVPSMWGRTVVF